MLNSVCSIRISLARLWQMKVTLSLGYVHLSALGQSLLVQSFARVKYAWNVFTTKPKETIPGSKPASDVRPAIWGHTRDPRHNACMLTHGGISLQKGQVRVPDHDQGHCCCHVAHTLSNKRRQWRSRSLSSPTCLGETRRRPTPTAAIG